MKKIYKLLVLGAVAALLTSCSKDDDDNSSTNLVGTWLQVGSDINGVSNWDVDYFDCEKDDLTTFNSNNTFEVDEGATKCDPSDPQLADSGTWNWTTEGSVMIVNGLSIEIVKLDSDDLIIKNSDFGPVSKAYFKRQ